MRNVITIARKELSTYFTTPWGWIALSAMSVVSAFFFLSSLSEFRLKQLEARQYGWQQLESSQPGVGMFKNLTDGVVINLLGSVLMIVLFVAPFLSMRLFSEERKQKTFELLFTAPIRSTEIVFGKYLGGMGVITVTLSVTLFYPLILSIFGASESGTALEWSTVGLGYLALLLWAGVCMGVGMFISALTESQMLAAFLTFTVLLLWLALGMFAQGLSEPYRSLLKAITFSTQFDNLLKGVLDLRALVFLGSAIVMSLLLTHRAVEAQRWT